MIVNNTYISIDETTTAEVLVSQDEELKNGGIIKLNNKEDKLSAITILFPEGKSIDEFIKILTILKEKINKPNIIMPDKKIKTI